MSDNLLIAEPGVGTATDVGWSGGPPGRSRQVKDRVFKALARAGRAAASALDWVYGAAALTLGLAILSAIPVVQFLSFGYLLEAAGRVARSGRLRDGFVGVRKASRVGSIVIGVLACWIPLQLISTTADAAQLVNPGGRAARLWRVGLVLATGLALAHVAAACARGGRVHHFLIPFGVPFRTLRRSGRGAAYVEARDAVWEFVAGLRLPYYFRLGFAGFAGTMAWLALPVSLMAAGRRWPALGFLGAALLGLVAMPLPFLQTKFAMEDRLRSLFDLRAVRESFGRAPWAFALSLLLTLTSALPLYLLKIEMIPRETVWLPSLVFIAFIFPARVLTGWAYGRSRRRPARCHWFFRWTGRATLLPTAALYVLVVFLSQYTAWRGVWSLYEQQAFLLPVPFLGV